VLLVPKASVSAEFGIVRGLTENGGRCYVEPRPLVSLGDELKLLRDELQKAEAMLQRQLIQTILKAASPIDAGIHAVARLDVVFSKAAFGILLKGTIPKVGEKGRISVDRFVHPVLALQNKDTVVPVDLRMYNDESNRVLIISGPNGGGKSLAMKSFGLVCIHVKMALPITSAASKTSPSPVVDFFENILIEMGDQQNLVEGESTFMARLNCLSSVIQRLLPPISLGNAIEPPILTSSLVLLDELGGGTDPAAGGAIAQAILEKLLEAGNCRIVATTHSPRLKALSYSNDDYECATVLLKRSEQSDFKLPTYQLQYGLIGDSYALGAASRAIPSLPNDVLSRAASLLAASNTPSNGDASSGELLRAMTDSLEKQIQSAEESRQQAEATQMDARDCRDALIALSSAYEKHLGKLEHRLESIYNALQLDESKSSLDVVGETLATIRTAKKKVKSEDELLRERGLKRVQDYYELVDGETVVIIAGGDWEGMSGTIVINANEPVKPGEVLVALSLGKWSDPYFQNDEPQDPMVNSLVLTFGRHQIAIWDYASVWDEERTTTPTTSVRESRQRLSSLLTSLPSASSKLSTINSNQGSELAESVSFTSSRQRKATAAKKRKRKS
jgi:DNA mismatch repair protein MutS2